VEKKKKPLISSGGRSWGGLKEEVGSTSESFVRTPGGKKKKGPHSWKLGFKGKTPSTQPVWGKTVFTTRSRVEGETSHGLLIHATEEALPSAPEEGGRREGEGLRSSCTLRIHVILLNHLGGNGRVG